VDSTFYRDAFGFNGQRMGCEDAAWIWYSLRKSPRFITHEKMLLDSEAEFNES